MLLATVSEICELLQSMAPYGLIQHSKRISETITYLNNQIGIYFWEFIHLRQDTSPMRQMVVPNANRSVYYPGETRQ